MPDITCNFMDAHDEATDTPTGTRCGARATHHITWADDRVSFGCAKHIYIDSAATVKPVSIVPLQRRFYDVDFGISYTICAHDERHVMNILSEVDHDFKETLAELGGAVIREMTTDEAWAKTFYDDEHSVSRAVATMQLGDWASSEY